ncbi:MAG: S8 family serine peptidase, partial [Holophagales bacterium]|nr:S8 family serine peptidase [Holophagales bacterium]
MTARLGPLLSRALERARPSVSAASVRDLSLRFGLRGGLRLPVLFQLEPEPVTAGETWVELRERTGARLTAAQDALEALGQDRGRPLVAAGCLAVEVEPESVEPLRDVEGGEWIDLDLRRPAFALDDAGQDLGLHLLRAAHPELDGAGVRVAVLDSGIDARHPALEVAEAVSTCDEDVSIPGLHGTRCAGILASRDDVVQGFAPGVEVLDVKVGIDGDGIVPTDGLAGFDAALDLGAQVILASWGLNQILPTDSDRGHGWSCPEGR